jgi:hypothetical protein
MSRQFLILTLIFINISSLNAQVKNSVYSMFGIGKLSDNSFGVNRSLGGTGIAFQSGRSINFINPASYIGIFPGSINMELGVYGIYGKSENNETFQEDGDVNFSYFATGIYCNKWWVLSLGLVPFSSVDYEINTINEIGGELNSIKTKFTGDGGLNRVYFGNSFNIFDGLSVGINASYVFGHITQTETASGSGSFSGYEIKNERSAQSLYLDYGIQYSIPVDTWLCTIGLIYGANKKLNTADNLEFIYNGTTNALEQDEQLDIKIPQKFGFGISFKRGNNFRGGIDYELGNWSSINFSNQNLDTKNNSRFSVGIEFSPTNNRQDESWFNSLFYRLGANYKNSYLKIDNTPIDSKGINLGIGIPYDKSSIINFAIEYGEEGTLNKGLIKNSYWMFYINISLYEFWSTITPRD